jgi:hypothetical protein
MSAGRRCVTVRCVAARRVADLRHHADECALARDYGAPPAAIRLNYGMQRVHGGGNGCG